MSPRTHLRRAALTGAALTAGLAFAPAAQASCPADDPCPRLPQVDMGKVVLAASLDPSRVDMVKTAGAGRSVKLVEQALKARKLLPKSAVDGYFGSTTAAAWAQLEVQLGQDKVWTRNALPGLQELQALGRGRFTVVNPIDVGPLVRVKALPKGNSDDGQDVVNTRTLKMFLTAQRNLKKANKKGWNMTIVQGGYCGAGCAEASAGTHSGGGSVDIRTIDTDMTGINNRVAALKRVGFAAWYRNWDGNQHIHATAINDPQATWEMHGKGGAPAGALAGYSGNCQVFEWKFKFDGLSGCNESRGSKDPNQQRIITWEGYQAS